jgi:hypothetical protein
MAQAAEHVTLKNGFAIDCSRREVVGDHVRLYMVGSNIGSESYLEVAAGAVVRVETIPDLPEAAPIVVKIGPVVAGAPGLTLTREEMHTMLSHAGTEHNIDEDLLASVVRAESGGQVRAVSRTGAQGLMQLMPGTATELGVGNAFQPEENIGGGTAYLDQLLKRWRHTTLGRQRWTGITAFLLIGRHERMWRGWFVSSTEGNRRLAWVSR